MEYPQNQGSPDSGSGDNQAIVVRLGDTQATLTAASDIQDLEHALLLATSRDISLSYDKLCRLQTWVKQARHRQINIIDGSTVVLLDLRRMPFALLEELAANVMYYAISKEHLVTLRGEILHRLAHHMHHLAPHPDCELDSCKQATPRDPQLKQFYTYLLCRMPLHELTFVARYCAESALGRRRIFPRLGLYARTRRLEALADAAGKLPLDVIIAADQFNVCVIRKRDGTLVHRWYHHVITNGELVMSAEHRTILLQWISQGDPPGAINQNN